MLPDDDNEGDFEEIAPDVFVREVSDEYAADMMGITPEQLRQRLEDIASGKEKTYTLDEVMDRFEAKDPGFKARVEAMVQEQRRKLH